MSNMNPKLKELMKEAPEGVDPFYHAIGTLGGNAVKEKYGNVGKAINKQFEMETGKIIDNKFKNM